MPCICAPKYLHLRQRNQYQMPTDIAFFVTGAHSIPGANDTLLRERYIEYMIALQKVFHYKVPVYGVLSELNPSLNHIPPFREFPFQHLTFLPQQELAHCKTKSQREFLSIQLLNEQVNDLEDNTFIIKLSGRYIPIDDSFFNLIKGVASNKQIQGIFRLAETDQPLQYTFFYALRWKWFKKFYQQSLDSLGTKCVEEFILEFYNEEDISNTLVAIPHLGVLAQINNENRFEIF